MILLFLNNCRKCVKFSSILAKHVKKYIWGEQKGMTEKPRTNENPTMITTLLFWGLAFLVIAAPLLRGLFYEIEYARAQLFVSLLALLTGISLIKNKKSKLKLSPVDFLALAFLAFYWLSIIKALDLKEAVLGAFRATVYVFVFYLSRYLSGDKRRRQGILLAVCFSTVLISLTALLHAVDVLPVELYNEYGAKRIISFLEHPNTFGIFSGMGLLLGLGLFAQEKSRILRILLACGAYLNTLGLMGSQSRGSWIIIIIALFLQGLLIPGEQRKKYLLSLAVLLTTIMVTSKGYLDGFYTLDYESSVTWLITGIVLSLAGNFLLTSRIKIIPRYHRLERYRTALVISICLLIGISAITYFTYIGSYLPSPASQILASDIIERAERISGQEGSYVDRLKMYRWAMNIVADNPFLGWGEGGWESLYLRYQDKLYWSTEVHSHPLQLWVEIGTFGFIAYLGIWLLILWNSLKSFAFNRRNSLDISLFLAIFTLFAHSAMDFDLSLPAVSLVFWTLGGTAISDKQKSRNWSIKAPKLFLPAISVLLAVFLAYPAYGEYKAQLIFKDAREAVRMGYHPMATEKLKNALDSSPYSGDIAAELALQWAYRYQDRGVQEYREEAARYADMTLSLKPYSVRNVVRISQVYDILGDFGKNTETQERLVFLVPKMPQLRLALAQSYYSLASADIKTGDIPGARSNLSKSREQLVQIQENYIAAGKYWNMRPAPETNLLLGKTSLLLGDWEKAMEVLQIAAGNNNLRNQAIPWLTLAFKAAQSEKYTQYYERQVKVNSQYLSQYEQAEQLLAELGG